MSLGRAHIDGRAHRGTVVSLFERQGMTRVGLIAQPGDTGWTAELDRVLASRSDVDYCGWAEAPAGGSSSGRLARTYLAADRRVFGSRNSLNVIDAERRVRLDTVAAQDVVVNGSGVPVTVGPLMLEPGGRDRSTPFQALGMNEVLAGESTVVTAIRQIKDGVEKVIEELVTGVDPWSVTRTRSRFLAHWPAAIGKHLSNDQAGRSDYSSSPGSRPTVVGGVSRLIARRAQELVRRRLESAQWRIAFQDEGELDPSSMRVMKPPLGTSWADPFPWSDGNSRHIFFEEWSGSDPGRIGVAEIGIDGHWEVAGYPVQPDYHVSYPALYFVEGELLMVPETGLERRIEAWRCIDYPLTWERAFVIIDDIEAYDTTLVRRDDQWWLLTTIASGASTTDSLHAFWADELQGSWQPHPRNPLKVDVRSARNGGWLVDGDALERRAQNCGPRYGWSVRTQVIEQLDEDGYIETGAAELSPEGWKGALGVHTLNVGHGLAVVDIECLVGR